MDRDQTRLCRHHSGLSGQRVLQDFFSSITRRIFSTIGADPEVEFIALDVRPAETVSSAVARYVLERRGSTRLMFDELLGKFRFAVPYRNLENSISFIAAEVDAFCAATGERRRPERVEILEAIFFQTTRAYLVGRIVGRDWLCPLVIALKNSDEGILVDAVIMSENDVSMLFSFTRSYFHVDLQIVGATVRFLKELLPLKPIDEIYTILGRAKQGKTERYRSFFKHLEDATDTFVHARGDKGLVMIVFTLPSYDVVFKIIKDRFAYPKNMLRQDVIDKYQLVFKHDRAGRLVDAQEFDQLRFPSIRFSPALLEDLLRDAADSVRLVDNHVIVEHCYIERRLTPLNLFLRENTAPVARRAVLDYGQSIRDLALSNIFPGDLLLKNFGVTRHGRVIFYDYDELCLLTECNFRPLPKARHDDETMRSQPWFYVGPRDVFPEQFMSFLGLQKPHLEAFMERHADLLSHEFWSKLQRRHAKGEMLEVIPYQARSWTEHHGRRLYPVR